MSIKIGINGFGRIGRTLFRQTLERRDVEVVAINDLGNNPANLCYMLRYDSVHGRLKQSVELREHAAEEKDWTVSEICVDGRLVRVFSEDRIENVPWNELDVDIVVDATGNGRNLMHARSVLGGSVRRVVMTNSPNAHVDFTFAFDVNDALYDPDSHRIVAASICDAVGLAPIVSRIHQQYGIASGFITTLHPWLGYQNLLDGKPSSTEFKERPDIYESSTYQVMGRASVGTLIPKSTSAVAAIEQLIPAIKGRLRGMSFRVPTEVVASGIATLELEKDTSTEEVRSFLRQSVRPPFSSYTEEPLISVDYKHSEESCVVDGKWVEVVNGRFLRFTTWYDNEWGYSARVLNVVEHLHRSTRKGVT
jgi:glyceraldehyde 3-phosphate dehydrogenase